MVATLPTLYHSHTNVLNHHLRIISTNTSPPIIHADSVADSISFVKHLTPHPPTLVWLSSRLYHIVGAFDCSHCYWPIHSPRNETLYNRVLSGGPRLWIVYGFGVDAIKITHSDTWNNNLGTVSEWVTTDNRPKLHNNQPHRTQIHVRWVGGCNMSIKILQLPNYFTCLNIFIYMEAVTGLFSPVGIDDHIVGDFHLISYRWQSKTTEFVHNTIVQCLAAVGRGWFDFWGSIRSKSHIRTHDVTTPAHLLERITTNNQLKSRNNQPHNVMYVRWEIGCIMSSKYCSYCVLFYSFIQLNLTELSRTYWSTVGANVRLSELPVAKNKTAPYFRCINDHLFCCNHSC